jgi:small subunit ribosomal protein S8
MITDPVADFIIRLKNASAVKKTVVSTPYSKLVMAIAEKLKQDGFIASVEKSGKKVRKNIEVTLMYEKNGLPTISGVKRVSKPGRRLYRGFKEIVPVRYGTGTLVLSTP